MAQETIDKIINIQFKYTDLVNGWAQASKAISEANAKLKEFKEAGDAQGVAKQTQLIKALRTEMNQYTREIQANVREEVKAEGSINQLNARIAKLTAQYNAMSGEVRKSSVGEALAKEIADVQTEVNKANEAVLNFRNNVGNYASAAKGFGPLNMQVQQIARELPSLTMSLSQFFLAISNNLPMFADELTRAKEANKALKAEGQATVPVFKQVVAAIFSWQTALVVGITLLTAYGKEIGEWVKSLFKAKEASISMEEAAKNVNEALEEGGSGIGEQIAKIKSLQTAWNELGSDLDARKKFITDNKDAFDELGVKVTDVNDAENLLVRNTTLFIQALQARAKAVAAQKIAAESYEKYVQVVAETETDLAKAEQLRDYYTKQKADREQKYGNLTADVYQRQIKASQAMIDVQQKEIDKINERRNAALEVGNVYTKIQGQFEKEAADIIQRAGIVEQSEEIADNMESALYDRSGALSIALQKKLATSRISIQQEGMDKEIELMKVKYEIEKKTLENKLATDKTLTDESRESIRELILAIDEKMYSEEAQIRQKWYEKQEAEDARNAEARIKIMRKIQDEMDALSLAQVKNKNYQDLIGYDKDRQIKAQQEIAQEELRIAKDKYEAIANMDEQQWMSMYGSIQAYEQARLQAENNIQDAIKKTTEISLYSERQAVQMQTTQLSMASSLIGSVRGLFSALGDDLKAFAIAEKALAIVQIIIDAQRATLAALASSFALGPIIGPAWFATQKGFITAQTAISIATTIAQAIPSFSTGGLVTGPGTGTSDSVPAMLSNGEAVMTANAVNEWGAMLSAMNVSSGGNAINVSNLPQRGDGMRGMERMMERVMMNMPSPVVSVVDINKGQRKVKVQDNISKLGRKKYA